MPTPPTSTRTIRRRLRPGRRIVAGAVVAAAIAGVGVVDLTFAQSASAAEPGQRTVGTTPVALTQPSDNLLGRTAPSADAATKGMFAAQVGWPVIPVNASLAANGHLVTYGTPINTAVQSGLVYDDWDPAFGTVASAHVQTPSMASYDSFCNNLVNLPDGRMLMVGGNGANGNSSMTMSYDPSARTEGMGPGLNQQRWYATALRRPDDSIAVIGGGNYYSYTAYQNPKDNSVVATTPEIGNGTGAWTRLTGATSTTAFGALNNRWWYPRAYNAPDGSVFGISGDQLWTMGTTGTGSIAVTGTLPTSMGVSGSSVMYAPGKILVAGGGEVANGTTTTATNAATVVDITGATPKVTAVAPMANRRQWDNATVLPTGEVLVNGGTIVGTDGGAANSSYTAEVWNPATQQWRAAATATRIRTYHSTSILLPSGAVFTGGGGVPGPEDNFNAEMYYPAYLFTKNAATGAVTWADRPKVTSLAGQLTWGGTITLGSADARTIGSVSLISAGSVTHGENTDQRRVPLTFTQNGASTTATLPTSASTLPPGSYLLSVTDSAGVPSAAQMVTLRRNAAGTVTVYENDLSAGRVGPVGTVVPGIVPLTVGSTVALETVSDPDVRVRTSGTAVLALNASDPAAATYSDSFVVRAGLASATGVSLESVLQPGSFLTLANGRAGLARDDGSAAFRAGATLLAKAGLQGNYTSFTSYADPSQYLRTSNGAVVSQAFDGSDAFRSDATFGVRPPLGPQAGFYSITNVNSALALSVQNGGTVAGTAVVQDTATPNLSREWNLRPTGEGHYTIVNAASGLLLGVQNGSRNAGATALVWGDNGTADHLWDITPSAGHWFIRNVNSGLLLGVNQASRAAGAQALQWTDNGTADHLWDFGRLGADVRTGATYTVTNTNSGLRMATAGANQGAAVVQSPAGAAGAQRWRVVDAGNGVVKIQDVATGLVLGIRDGSTKAGGEGLVWGDNGTADHLWRVVPRGAGWVLVSVNSNEVLGVSAGQKNAGAQTLQWYDTLVPDQVWTLAAA